MQKCIGCERVFSRDITSSKCRNFESRVEESCHRKKTRSGGRKRNSERRYARRNILEHEKLQPYSFIVEKNLPQKKAASGTAEKRTNHIQLMA